MHRLRLFLRTAVLIVPLVVLACSSGNGAGRTQVAITQTDEACTPATVSVAPGEALHLVVRNDGKKDHEIEGTEGTKLEELIVPAGRSRSVNYTMPNTSDTRKLKCYVPGGSTTIIQLVPGTLPASPSAGS